MKMLRRFWDRRWWGWKGNSPQLGCPPRCPIQRVVSSRACGEAESQGLCGAVLPVSRPTRPPPGLPWEAELTNVAQTFPRGTGLSLFPRLSCTPQPCSSPNARAEEPFVLTL